MNILWAQKKEEIKPTLKVLQLEQEVTGLPDLQKGKSLKQKLTMDLKGRRVLLEVVAEKGKERPLSLSREGANRILLRMDLSPPLIQEIIDKRKMFKLHEGDLNQLQEDRNIQEMNEIRHAKKQSAAERDKLLRDNFLRLDGKRIVEVKEGEKKKLLGYDCKKVTVTENGRVVIEAWMAEKLSGGSNFYELYSHLGTFSKEVLEKTKSLKGLPLEAKIKVITAAPTFEIKAVTTKVQPALMVSPLFYDVPTDYREIEDIPPLVKCPICLTEVERDEPPGGQIRLPELTICFNTASCKKTFIKALRKNRLETIKKAKEAQRKRHTPPAPKKDPPKEKEAEKKGTPPKDEKKKTS